MWSAQPWRYMRVGADKSGAVGIDVYIPRPVVSVVGGIQPHLHPLLGDADSGFRPRWLPHLAPLETVTWGPRVHTASEWDSAVEKLYLMRRRREWVLTGEAFAMWQQECARWKRQARGSENPSTSAALDKSDIQSARIALVIAESMYPGAGGPVPVDAMRCAIAITEYVMNCWRALPGHDSFALSRRDEILNGKVDELLSWLETREGRRATRTQIKERGIAGVRRAEDVSTLLAAYAAVYPGTVVQQRPEGGGRPGQVVCAPVRGPRTADARVLPSGSGVSERSETPVMDAGRVSEVKPQVGGHPGVSEQVLGNSVLGNSDALRAAAAVCAVCAEPLNQALAAAGYTTHPTCDPGEPAATEQEPHTERESA